MRNKKTKQNKRERLYLPTEFSEVRAVGSDGVGALPAKCRPSSVALPAATCRCPSSSWLPLQQRLGPPTASERATSLPFSNSS